MKRQLLWPAILLLAATIRPGFGLPAVGQEPNEQVRVFLIGDSTMADKPVEENPERGWGQLFPQYFDHGVAIKNFAVNGRSTKSFIDEKRWDAVRQQLQRGDWVFIQFGHNDSKSEDPTRYAAPRAAYRENLTRFVKETREKGASPVLLTPVMRRKFDSQGRFVDTHGEYPDVVRETARTLDVPLIDLHQKSRQLIEQHGVEGSKILFLWIGPQHFKTLPDGKKDDTHFSAYGAAQVASLVTAGIRELKLPLGGHLRRSDFAEKDLDELPKVYQPHFRQASFPITQFGAKGDGITLNTAAINAAIEACHAAGGGTVVIPRGLWLTGPIVLRSQVNLHLERGALVTFSGDFDRYPLTATSFEGLDTYRAQSPISARGAENIAITGEGIFDGAGDHWRPVKKVKVTEAEWRRLVRSGGALDAEQATWYPSAQALQGSLANASGQRTPRRELKDYEAIKDFLRPNMVQFNGCKYVLIEGVTFQNSPAWTLHMLLSEHLTLRNVKVKNPWYGQNTDALDLDSSRHVLVQGCVFDTGDDGICLKSGRDEAGRRRGIPTENVLVEDCTVYHAHGGFVIGSEMSGGVRNIFVSRSTFIGTDIGLRFKTTRGRGGVVEQIYASRIEMKEIVGEAILFDMYYGGRDPIPQAGEKETPPKIELLPVTEATPQFRDFFIRDITCSGAKRGIAVRGLPEMNVKQIKMENLVIQSQEGVYLEEAQNIDLRNVAVYSEQTSPVITVRNGRQIAFEQFHFKPEAELLMRLAGERTAQISLPGTDLSPAKNGFQYTEGATPKTLR